MYAVHIFWNSKEDQLQGGHRQYSRLVLEEYILLAKLIGQAIYCNHFQLPIKLTIEYFFFFILPQMRWMEESPQGHCILKTGLTDVRIH